MVGFEACCTALKAVLVLKTLGKPKAGEVAGLRGDCFAKGLVVQLLLIFTFVLICAASGRSGRNVLLYQVLVDADTHP